MSAVAHTSIEHANIASVQLDTEPEVTSISVSARIDYIQRFSKQAVLVIDNNVDVYTQAARQFLTHLSKEKINQEENQDVNVAFVSASTKLNDIQMRCRLIEQLFANTLFDPEKSLAVSILQLSKKSKDGLTIVIEHAHALSLQMKYELCQLVDVANKTHSKINVVLFGQEQAAQDAAINKTIFKNKLAIIDANTGQLFSLEHAKFNNKNTVFTSKFWQKLIITVVTITALIGVSWFALIEYDSFGLSQLPAFNVKGSDKSLIEANSKWVNKNKKESVAKNFIVEKNANELAATSEIHAALLGKGISVAKVENMPAQATDILQALDFIDAKTTLPQMVKPELQMAKLEIVKEEKAQSKIDKKIVPAQVINKKTDKPIRTELPLVLTPSYYVNLSTGYVVQIVGFTDMNLLASFIDKYQNIEYFSYQKKLNEQLFVVLTTKVFESQEDARLALQALPQAIIERGVWIKALSTVQAEINEA